MSQGLEVGTVICDLCLPDFSRAGVSRIELVKGICLIEENHFLAFCIPAVKQGLIKKIHSVMVLSLVDQIACLNEQKVNRGGVKGALRDHKWELYH
jgi:hypothetical protein